MVLGYLTVSGKIYAHKTFYIVEKNTSTPHFSNHWIRIVSVAVWQDRSNAGHTEWTLKEIWLFTNQIDTHFHDKNWLDVCTEWQQVKRQSKRKFICFFFVKSNLTNQSNLILAENDCNRRKRIDLEYLYKRTRLSIKQWHLPTLIEVNWFTAVSHLPN